jgi:hypothetical protein
MLPILLVLSLNSIFIQPETGSPVPLDSRGVQGYSGVAVSGVTGQEQWTGTGPWGGNVGGFAVSPVDNSVVIVGCGFSMAPDAGGVWKSSDGGVTWSATDLAGDQVNGVCPGGSAAPGVFYAATATGLYRSTNNGTQWNTVSTEYYLAAGVSDENPDILIVGLSSNRGIRRSADGGTTWQTVGLNNGYMKGFGSDPDRPDTMYVAISGGGNSLYRSVDAGVSWSPAGPSTSGWGVLVAPFGSGETIILSTSDGYYMSTDFGNSWDLVVSGVSYSPAICDGTNLYAPEINSGGVYESTDHGATWSLNTQGLYASFWQAGCASSAGCLVGHWGGVFRTVSPGTGYTVSQEGIGNAFVYAVSYCSTTGTLLAGGDSHGIWKSTDGGASWDIVLPGPLNWTVYDIQPKTDAFYTGPVRYAATGGGVFRSDDSGDSWVPAGLNGTSISDIAFDPSDPDRAWAGTAISGVFYTTDGGVSWNTGTDLPTATFYPSVDLVELPSGDLRVLVSFQHYGTGVYYSDDGGVSYTAVAVPGSSHPCIAAGSGTDPMVYLSTDNGVFRSFDRGVTWERCPGSSGLSWSVMGLYNSNVFAGTDGYGVKWSPDAGTGWQYLNWGINSRVVWDIIYGEEPAQLFAGLRGFGVVELTSEQLGMCTGTEGLIQEQFVALSVTPNPAVTSMEFTVNGFSEGSVLISVYSAAGRLVHKHRLSSGASWFWSPDDSLSSGLYLVRASGDEGSVESKLVLVR